jgi:WD40 repeat protein
MSFAALAKKAKASSKGEAAVERPERYNSSALYNSTRGSAILHDVQSVLNNKSEATDAPDALRLALPQNGSSLPEHPSTKSQLASSAPKVKTNADFSKNFLAAVKAQIAKEQEQERLIEAASAHDSSVRVFTNHLRTKEASECIGNTDCVNCFALLSNGEFASGSGDGRVLIWNEGTGEVIQVLQNHEGPVLSMAISHSGLKLITGSSDMSMKKWNLSEPIISQDQQYNGHTRWVQCVAVHRDFVFSASLDKTVRQWDLIDGKCNFIFAGHADWVSSLCVHHQTLYTGSWDGIVRLWSISTWECTHFFEGHTGPVLSICLDVKDADAKPNFIYSASQDGRVKRWSLIDYVELNTYSGHVLGVSTVDCSSTFLASGSFDSTIRLYDLNVTEPLHVLYGHEDSVTCVKFSVNGLNLYSSSDDFTIRKWDCKTGVCLRIYGIPKSQQLIRGAGLDGKKSGSLSLLLNFGDDDDPTSLRSRLRKILREEENESILLEHEFSRRLELYKNRLLADHLKEKEGQAAPRGSTESPGGNPNFEDSVVLDLKDDYQNQRYRLIAVYSDAKEALREDVLDCAGLGASAVQLLWENKQEALKVAWLECKNKAVPPSLVSASQDQLVPDFDPAEVASSILHGILDNIEPATATLLTPEVVAQGILNGILDFVCKSQSGTDPDASRSVPKAKASLQKSAFDAKSASIDVSDVSLDDALSPQLLACLNSILHRANRRFHRSKSAFNAKFFDSVMLQADDRERRIEHLKSSVLDQEERKMLLQQEETRTLALISAEAREIHIVLTQVASEIDRLVSDHRQIWLFKFSGLFTESQWQQLETAVAELILKHQSQSDELYAEFDLFCSEVTSKGLPLSSIEERCEQMNDQMSDLQKSLDDELLRVLMGFDFMTADLLAQLRTVFGRDSSAVMLQFKLEMDRQAKRSVDDALERARLEDIEKEETARLAAKKAFKDKLQREAEAAKLAKLNSLKASESLRAKQKVNFEMDLAQSLKSEDFSDLENSCFAFLHRYDLRRRPVLVLKMANFPVDPCLEGRPQFDDFEAPSDDWQRRIMRYVMLKLDQIIEAPGSTHGHVSRYLLVVDFSNSSPSCRPSISFLQQAWYFLPDRARTLMDECVIIDSPFWFRVFVWFMKPIVSHRVWKKVRFLRQYSDLWGLLSHTDLRNISSSDKSGNKVFAFSGEASAIHGKPSFLSMLSRARTAHLIKGQDSQEFFEKYFEIINAAKVADWSDIMELHFLDTSGVDILGRPVIMFIASNFTCNLGESFLNRCLVYMMLKVHELMFEQKKQVSILVICSNISTSNIPSTAWLQAAAKKFPYKIRKMIQCIFLLNPGFLVKKLLWVLRSIASPKIANKLVEVETLLQLLRHFNHVDLRLPPSVLQDVPFGGTPEERKMMTADIRAAIKRGHDVGLDQKVDFSQQFKLGVPSDYDIESFFTLTCNDFEDINGKEIVKFAGRDVAKRPVISITLANVPASKGEIVMNKVFRLVVLLLQPLSQLPYSIALIATNFAAANQPGIDWMKDVHKSIDSAARKNLRAVYLFEPTFLVKSATFALQSFVSTKFFKKIHLASAHLS